MDSIDAYMVLDTVEKRLLTTKNAFRYNSIIENKKELGHTYMDFVSVLSERVAELELENKIPEIKAIHLQIIQTCELAERYIELYDHQKENLAYSHVNYAVALSREVMENKNDPKPQLQEMMLHLEKAKSILEVLPKNLLLEQAEEQVASYLEWVKNY